MGKNLFNRYFQYESGYWLCISGISKVKSAPAKAFRATLTRKKSRTFNADTDEDLIAMSSLEMIADSLLEIIEVLPFILFV